MDSQIDELGHRDPTTPGHPSHVSTMGKELEILATLEELNSIPIVEMLEHDSRPTFIIDLDPDMDIPLSQDKLNPIFCNQSLRTYDRLLDAIVGGSTNGALTDPNPAYTNFCSWAKSVTTHDDSKEIFPISILYNDLLWTGSTVRKRWRMISGNKCYLVANVAAGDLSSGPPTENSTVSGKTSISPKATIAEPVLHNAKSTPSPEPSSKLKTTRNSVIEDELKSTLIASNNQRKSADSDPHDSTLGSSESKVSRTPSVMLSIPQHGITDWTRTKNIESLPRHVQFARGIDWASTPLGSLDTWSPELRQMVNLLMADPHPAALYWSDDMTMMYNEAYAINVAGRKHPELMGTGFKGPFSEIWDLVGPVFTECARTGESFAMANQMLPIERHGFLEETYFSWTCIPLYGGSRRIQGFYNCPFETTQHQVGIRRMKTLRKLGEQVAVARTVKGFWAQVLEGLDENQFDVPFALLYSVVDGDDGDLSSTSSSGSSMSLKSCVLEGGLGIPKGHAAAPPLLDLKSREGFIPSFREAMRTREPTKLQTRDGTLPESLLEGIEWRGYGEQCREAIIFPVRPTTGENVLGFLIIGVNPRRAYDDDYKSFTTMLNRQLATSLASTILFEEEIRRGKTAAEAAALEQQQLSQQLEVQTSRLQRMTALSPVGLFYIDPGGLLLEANDCWFEMTGHPRVNFRSYSWVDSVKEEDRMIMSEVWPRLTVERLPWSGEVRLNRPWVDPVTKESCEYWILVSAHPEFDSDESLRSIMGSITGISHIKWAEGLQNQRLKEAEETRRQQNEFIDITSHEMRNPLSAMLQCADDITYSLHEYNTKFSDSANVPTSIIENCIDAANTIVLCAQHQKCIVDDILTISKLDSNLLLITPAVVQPVAVTERAVKMFDAEFQKKNIKIDFCVQESIKELGVDWVVLDPSRLLQVLINLLTNAIKFTQTQVNRSITVRLAASQKPPPWESQQYFQYIPPKNNRVNSITFGDEWGPGEVLFLQFEVEDTGCGLTVEEKKLLFLRFSQASPRTHAQYGGSGLGLFISRQLTELHGGQIGVGSEAGVGSTFAFYIKVKKSTSPKNSPIQMASPIEPDWRRDSYTSHTGQTDTKLQWQQISSSHQLAEENISPLHVLIVEDNLVNQRVLSRQLEKVGCIVNVASHGGEALVHLETTEFCVGKAQGGRKLSVILMDLEMPVMDGLTCVRNIRAMEADGSVSRHVPVIAVTANVRSEQIAVAKASGMDDVVSKPFRIPELMAKMESLLIASEQGHGHE